ncbi:MAG: right-handed parallel beta-helix repeat-containing protein, partial [Candidatus Heimdallarchaeaceae archaeon]
MNIIDRNNLQSVMIPLLILLFSSSIVFAYTSPESQIKTYISSSPITISGDSALESFCSTGSGTEVDPYIIENFEISGGEKAGIKISDTTSYFIIRNCLIQGGYRGIYLDNIAFGTARIENNTCYNNWICGIQLANSRGSIVVNNTIVKSNEGRGIFSYKSSYSNISYNIFENAGLEIQEFDNLLQATYEITGNIVNGKVLGYFKNIKDIIINETIYGQIIVANCSNLIIENQVLSTTYIGISVFYSQNITFTNNSFSNHYTAILIYHSSNCTFSLNNFTQNIYSGLSAQLSSHLNITANSFFGNRIGIELGASNSNVSYNKIENNSDYGISLGSTSTICQNYIYNSGRSGMWVSGLNNLIYSNILESNKEYGMDIRGSNNVVYSNNLVNNQLYGVFIIGGLFNLVYQNDFDGNNYHAPYMSQGYDWGINNSWYNHHILVGNRWSNAYSFTSYKIEGPSGSYDIYPIFPDSDNDKLPDEWEVIYGLSTNHNDTYLDPDEDLLVNYYEFRNQTNPLDSDTDDDLILDGDEVNIYETNPVSSDTDHDQLSDYQEIFSYGTNPLNPDTDNDRMPDNWEVDTGLNPLLNDSSLDPDEDNLSNLQEFNFGTDPLNNDTDTDGLTDYEEIFTYITNPNRNDSDSDKLSDYDEIRLYQTDPNNPDTDGDGLKDYKEIIVYGTDPNNPDTDGDGLKDGFEVKYG